MADPLGFMITWSTYGTWLPGDQRGWVLYRRGWQLPDPILRLEAGARMTETACRLDREQRRAVEEHVAETCRWKGWVLHAENCRSNHLHVVVSADTHPKTIRSQLKAWCTRKLKTLEAARTAAPGVSSATREQWWADAAANGTLMMPTVLKRRSFTFATDKTSDDCGSNVRWQHEALEPGCSTRRLEA